MDLVARVFLTLRVVFTKFFCLNREELAFNTEQAVQRAFPSPSLHRPELVMLERWLRIENFSQSPLNEPLYFSFGRCHSFTAMYSQPNGFVSRRCTRSTLPFSYIL